MTVSVGRSKEAELRDVESTEEAGESVDAVVDWLGGVDVDLEEDVDVVDADADADVDV